MDYDVERQIKRYDVVEIIILIVGIIIGFAGFLMINTLYKKDGTLSWEMILAVFAWLTVFGIIILCSLIYYNLRVHLEENTRFTRAVIGKQSEMIKLLKKRK